MKYQLSPDEIKVVRDIVNRGFAESTNAERNLAAKLQRIFQRADYIVIGGNL